MLSERFICVRKLLRNSCSAPWLDATSVPDSSDKPHGFSTGTPRRTAQGLKRTRMETSAGTIAIIQGPAGTSPVQSQTRAPALIHCVTYTLHSVLTCPNRCLNAQAAAAAHPPPAGSLPELSGPAAPVCPTSRCTRR